MKTVFYFFSILLIFGCCRDHKTDTSELFSTDMAFSKMSADKGLNAAFIFYADDSVVKLRDGNFPITGKIEMTRVLNSRPDTGMVLTWKPVVAEIASSNDLGYTYGEWELYLRGKDTTMYGNYISIWKKKTDGTWKYVLDAGTNTPKPAH